MKNKRKTTNNDEGKYIYCINKVKIKGQSSVFLKIKNTECNKSNTNITIHSVTQGKK